MHRVFLAALFLFTCALTPVSGAWWWPFGAKDTWSATPQPEQDVKAVPYMELARSHLNAGNLSGALAAYRTVHREFPGSRFAPEALFQTGRIQKERKKWRRAFDAFQRIMDFYPYFPQFNEVISEQFEVATALAEGINTRYLGLIPYKNFDRAITYYERLVANAPYSDFAPLALMNIALIERHRRNAPEAIDALDRLINNYPASLLTTDAYLQLADTFAGIVTGPRYDQGATREAISYYRDFLILYPESDRVSVGETGLRDMEEILAESKAILGEYYLRYRRYLPGARVFLNEAITAAPESRAAARARELLLEVDRIDAGVPMEQKLNPPRQTFLGRLAFWNPPPIVATSAADRAAMQAQPESGILPEGAERELRETGRAPRSTTTPPDVPAEPTPPQ